jgi:hypothetical protein
MTVPRSGPGGSGTVTGTISRALVPPSLVRWRAAAAVRLGAVRRCQEVQVVTCPESSPAACLVT